MALQELIDTYMTIFLVGAQNANATSVAQERFWGPGLEDVDSRPLPSCVGACSFRLPCFGLVSPTQSGGVALF